MDQPTTPMQTPSKYETGVQLFSRVNSQNSREKGSLDGVNPKLFPNGGPHPDQIIEIILGKDVEASDVLIDFIVRCILPPEFGDEYKGLGVIIINTEFHIKLLKIIKVIETKTKKFNLKSRKKQVIENALKNILFINCYQLEDLETVFFNLEKIVHNNNNVALVILDNVTTYFWSARYSNPTLSYDEHIFHILNSLYKQMKDLNLVLIYTNRIQEKTQVSNRKKQNLAPTSTIWIEKGTEYFLASVKNCDQDLFVIPLKINIEIEW